MLQSFLLDGAFESPLVKLFLDDQLDSLQVDGQYNDRVASKKNQNNHAG